MDIQELLDDLEIPYVGHGEHEHATSGWVNVDCPFCSREAGYYRLGINLEWGNCSCWFCGSHRLAETLQEYTNKNWHECKKLVQGLGLHTLHGDARRDKKRGVLELPTRLGPLLPPHKAYLKSRGFDPEELERVWHIQGIGLHPKMPWRIFIPIYYRGEVVSWTTRTLSKEGRRYQNAAKTQEVYSLKELLFGEDFCRHAVIVCEGPLDAMKIGPGAVATCGVAYTQSQVMKIAKYPVRVLCFDSEPDAQKRAKKLLAELSVLPGQTHNVLLETGKDAAAAHPKEIKALRKKFLDTYLLRSAS